MTLPSSLTLTADQHESARRHLFSGDGLEAAVILVCAKAPGPRLRMLVRDVVLVPYEQCQRKPDYLRWPGSVIEEAIDLAEGDGLSLILLHSHPSGLFNFSNLDNESDRITMPSLFQAVNAIHGSAIMVPSGAIKARLYQPNLTYEAIDLVTVPGHDLKWWWSDESFAQRPMAFTSQTRDELGRLRAGIIGVSGTGSIVAEQAARLGFGEVLLIDFDHIEKRNLNRILNSTQDDAKKQRPKVEVFERAITSYRGTGVAVAHHGSMIARDAVLAVSQCDVLFCCVDTHDARQLADLSAAAFLIPLFDVGVTIPTLTDTDGCDKIIGIYARVDYVRPGGPTLQDRKVYTEKTLREEHLRRNGLEAYATELAEGYIKGVMEQAPSVITLNMRAASDLMMEFLARTYPFRSPPHSNKDFVRRELSDEEEFIAETEFEAAFNPVLARGDKEPLLMLPKLRSGVQS